MGHWKIFGCATSQMQNFSDSEIPRKDALAESEMHKKKKDGTKVNNYFIILSSSFNYML